MVNMSNFMLCIFYHNKNNPLPNIQGSQWISTILMNCNSLKIGMFVNTEYSFSQKE